MCCWEAPLLWVRGRTTIRMVLEWEFYCLKSRRILGLFSLFVLPELFNSRMAEKFNVFKIVIEASRFLWWWCSNIMPFIHSFIHSSMALQPFVGPWPLLQFRNLLYTVGRTPWTGGQPVARPLLTHRTTQTQNERTYKHPCLEWDSKPRSQRSSERPLWSATVCPTGDISAFSNIICEVHIYLLTLHGTSLFSWLWYSNINREEMPLWNFKKY
jgi:hypothetical protein